jgi:Zn-dependent protease with chaperone function
MDFFEAQETARSRSRTLVLLYLAAIVGIIAAVYIAATLPLAMYTGQPMRFQPEVLLWSVLGVGLIVGVGSLTKTSQLRKGGSVVAEMLGGRRVRPDTTDPDERRLLNVVEEMSIASGTPVPDVFVLDHEEGINAFAAGFGLHDAAVAVTRGTLRQLDRDELQGVIAHEFSHILNGDMRLNIRLIGLLHGILLLAIIGRGLLYVRGGGRGRDGGAQIALIGLVLLIVGYIGVLFGRLIQAAVSRQREYLADAAAVQFTRNPDGIAGALKKIGGYEEGARVRDHHAEEVGHMFFARGVRGSLSGLFATHPPLEERIRRVDRAFEAMPREREGAAQGAAAGALGFAAGGAVASAGAPTAEQVRYAGQLLGLLPAGLRAAAHDPAKARALVFALLLSDEPEIRERQLGDLSRDAGADAADRADGLLPAVRKAGEAIRLPLVDVALPTLRQLSPPERRDFRQAVRRLIEADGRIRVFDFALMHIIDAHLDEREDRRPKVTIRSLDRVQNEVSVLLSALAWAGAEDESSARAALAEGTQQLPGDGRSITLHDQAELDLPRVDAALTALESTSMGVRRQILEACARLVLADAQVRAPEAELLRAVAESLECPIPPLIPDGARADRFG